MYLHEATVKNYSIHRETKVSLFPVSVFVGPNGGGKSAFFEALLNFSMLARGRLSEAFGPYPYSFAATRHRAASQISRIGYDVVMSVNPDSRERVRYRIDYSHVDKGSEAAPPRFEIYRETLEPDGKVLFDRESPDKSVLKGALKHLAHLTALSSCAMRRTARIGTLFIKSGSRMAARQFAGFPKRSPPRAFSWPRDVTGSGLILVCGMRKN